MIRTALLSLLLVLPASAQWHGRGAVSGTMSGKPRTWDYSAMASRESNRALAAPVATGDRRVFLKWRSNEVVWNPVWMEWDLSGVNWFNPRGGCLLSPTRAIAVAHFPYRLADTFDVYTRDTGQRVRLRIRAHKKMEGLDLQLITLADAAPPTVATYGAAPHLSSFWDLEKLTVLVCKFYDYIPPGSTTRKPVKWVFPRVAHAGSYQDSNNAPGLPGYDYPNADMSYIMYSKPWPGSEAMHANLIRGDSGHPVLAMLPEGKLGLVALHSSPLHGPNYWSRSLHLAIQNGFNELEAQASTLAPLP